MPAVRCGEGLRLKLKLNLGLNLVTVLNLNLMTGLGWGLWCSLLGRWWMADSFPPSPVRGHGHESLVKLLPACLRCSILSTQAPS